MDKRTRKNADPVFVKVMARMQERLDALGIDRAPGPWLAEHLGVTRQLVSLWGKTGIPSVWVVRVAEACGMNPSEIRTDPVPIDLPPEIMDELIVVSRKKRRSLAETIIELVRAGLKRNP